LIWFLNTRTTLCTILIFLATIFIKSNVNLCCGLSLVVPKAHYYILIFAWVKIILLYFSVFAPPCTPLLMKYLRYSFTRHSTYMIFFIK
jgi:hypothetical protein